LEIENDRPIEHNTNSIISKEANVIAINQIQPPIFDESKDKASEWIMDFENIADINEWSDLQKTDRPKIER